VYALANQRFFSMLARRIASRSTCGRSIGKRAMKFAARAQTPLWIAWKGAA
jgi:hypothetical protein